MVGTERGNGGGIVGGEIVGGEMRLVAQDGGAARVEGEFY